MPRCKISSQFQVVITVLSHQDGFISITQSGTLVLYCKYHSYLQSHIMPTKLEANDYRARLTIPISHTRRHHLEELIRRRPQEPPRSYTSIGQIFNYQIMLSQVFGGFLFDWSNRYLAWVYKALAVISIVIFFRVNPIVEKSTLDSISESLTINYRLYMNMYRCVVVVYLVGRFFVDFRYHDTINIILRKKLDVRYLTGPIGSTTQRWSKFDLHQPSSTSFHRARSGGVIGSAGAAFRRYISEPAYHGRYIDLIHHLFVYVVIAKSLADVLATELARGYYIISPECSLAKPRIRDQQVENFTTTTRSPWSAEQSSNLTGLVNSNNTVAECIGQQAWSISFYWLYLARLLVLKLALNISGVYFHGLFLICIMIVATAAQLLKRINEQDEMLLPLLSAPRPVGKKPSSKIRKSSTKTMLGPRLGGASYLIATTHLMVQIRDVLSVLQQTTGLLQLASYTHDTALILTFMGLFFAMVSAKQPWLGIYISYHLFFYVIRILSARLVFQMLRHELVRLQDTNHRRLAEQSCRGESRIEATMRLRLAQEMERISPTNWFSFDVRSFLFQIFSMVVFAVGLQKIAEISLKG